MTMIVIICVVVIAVVIFGMYMCSSFSLRERI